MQKDVARALTLSDAHLEGLVGLRVVNRDRHMTVGRVPEETDVDPVTDAAVELARQVGRRGVHYIRMSRAAIFDVWIHHVPLLSHLPYRSAYKTNEVRLFRLPGRRFFIGLLA
jgi:hypothetical protein